MSRLNIKSILKQVEALLAQAGALPPEAEQVVEKLLDSFVDRYWDYYRWLQEYRADPSDEREAVECEIRFVNQLPLNKSNADLLVSFLQYTEYAADGSIRIYLDAASA